MRLGALVLCWVGCASPSQETVAHTEGPPRRQVAATVGDVPILASDVARRMRDEGLPARQAVQRLIDEELLHQSAVERGLLSRRELLLARRQAAVQKLLAVEVESRVGVGDVSAEQVAIEYRKAEALTAEHILVKIPRDATPELARRARELAAAIHKAARQVTDSESFVALAARFTDPDLKVRHEALGEFVRDGRYLDEFVDEAMRLREPGEMSRPFQTSFGWHIVRLQSRRNHLGPTVEAARPVILDTVVARLRRTRYEELVRALTRGTQVHVDEGVFAQAAPP